MARPLRIRYPGAVYHITCRGNERKNIFKDDKDRKRFLGFLVQSLDIYNVKIFSYVLMSNHFHFLVETPLGNISEFMRHFNITYTGYYNWKHKRSGHLYQGRYKSILVEKDAYLAVLSCYIHLNPVRIKALAKSTVEEKISVLEKYYWSSLHGYLSKRKKLSFIDYDMILEKYGGDSGSARGKYKEDLYSELLGEVDIKEKISSQAIIGREGFIEWVRENFLESEKSKEFPDLRKIRSYGAKENILKAIKKVTGKGLAELKLEKGEFRQMAMDILYRYGGMKGEEIGKLFGVGYTSVSQERRRFRERMNKDESLKSIMKEIENKCQQ